MPGTRCINARELRQLYDRLGAKRTVQHLSEALQNRHLRPSDFSIRDLAESLVPGGNEWVANMRAKSGRASLMEAGTVDYSAFSNITGQIFFTEIREHYEDEAFVFSKLIPTKPSKILDTEKIPGIGGAGDKFGSPVEEGEAYPSLQVVEDYQEIAGKRTRGGIINVTRLAVEGDRTGQLLEHCQKIGFYLGLNKEKRIIDALIDENGGATSITAGGHRYHWRGTSYATYQTTTPWINKKTSNGLTDWTKVEQLELQLAGITDPFTGEPVMIKPTHLIVAPDLLHTANRILTATNVQTHVGGYATSGNLQDYHAPSPLSPYKVASSRLLKARLATDTDWFLGAPEKAIAYYENWPVTVTQLGAGSEMEFTHDVILRVKASERGAAAVVNPRLIAKSSA